MSELRNLFVDVPLLKIGTDETTVSARVAAVMARMGEFGMSGDVPLEYPAETPEPE